MDAHPEANEPMPTWVKGFIAVAILAVATFAVVHLLGRGFSHGG